MVVFSGENISHEIMLYKHINGRLQQLSGSNWASVVISIVIYGKIDQVLQSERKADHWREYSRDFWKVTLRIESDFMFGALDYIGILESPVGQRPI